MSPEDFVKEMYGGSDPPPILKPKSNSISNSISNLISTFMAGLSHGSYQPPIN